MPDRLALREWIVTTCREGEAPRRGIGRESLEQTLRHLERRGDAYAHWRDVRDHGIDSYVRVSFPTR